MWVILEISQRWHVGHYGQEGEFVSFTDFPSHQKMEAAAMCSYLNGGAR